MANRTCSVTDCITPPHARGMCNPHYLRAKKRGMLPPKKARTERFWEKVDKTDTCWNWTGSIGTRGYGHFYDGERVVRAHRYSYVLVRGPIADDMVLDHLCRNTSCVHPDHLRVVTQKQNMEHVSVAQSNTSGARGVQSLATGQFRVIVVHNGRQHYGGRFADLSEANDAAVALRNRLYTCNDLDRRTA